MTSEPPSPPLELWGGIECTVNRVGDRWFDQIVSSRHEERDDDLDRFASTGIRAIRYPVLWERAAPHSLEDIAWRGSDRRLAHLHDLGIRPIAGLLHHGSGPAYTSLLDPEFPQKLARYGRLVAQRYPWITDFTPVNEPLTTARFSGLYGHWYPHGRSDRDYVRALLNQLRGVVLTMRAIREITPHARLIQTEDCGRTFGRAAVRAQIVHEGNRRWLTGDLLTGRVDDRHPLHGFLTRGGMTEEERTFFLEAGCPPDILGLNYYLTSDRYLDDRLERYPRETHGSNGHIAYADVDAVRARPAGIAGHEAHLLAAWKRYRIPVAVTEVHLGCTREEQLRWLVEAWNGAHRARARGVDVRAVTAWALLGSFDWDSLVTRPRGHYEPGAFDVRAPVPRATALASTLKQLAAGRAPSHPAIEGEPWWRRPHHTIHATTSRAQNVDATARPVLIIGATGTLGRAFQRICELRGLVSRLAGRHEVDIAEPARVDAIFRRLRPWAVINAAGYVRVDDAEGHGDACCRANVAGPINLAAACRRRGVRLVTFSSDLVFDGSKTSPYVEEDRPRPLNVYGAAKAEAERRVLDILPVALVIRTSAFFGPWDDRNFLAWLFRALERGSTFAAPVDSVVSPTYVPDLVQASLDLLVDGECGVWHLANDGAMTWFEFACTAAARGGRTTDLILPVETAQAWGPATRPRYSALSSSRAALMPSLHLALDAYLQEAPHAQVATGTDGCASR